VLSGFHAVGRQMQRLRARQMPVAMQDPLDAPGAVQPIKDGKFIPLAVTSAKRLAVGRVSIVRYASAISATQI